MRQQRDVISEVRIYINIVYKSSQKGSVDNLVLKYLLILVYKFQMTACSSF